MIQPLENVQDARLALYGHVGDHAWLAARGLFVAEGRMVVERLLRAGRYSIQSILVTPAAVRALEPLLAACPADIFVVSPDAMRAVTRFNFHRGCLALARRPSESTADAVLAERTLDCGRLLALEAVGNPDNVGGLFRTAAAFGVEGVLLDPASGDPLYRKAVRTSMGAVLTVPFARLDEWPAGLEHARQRGFRVVALTPSRDAMDIADFRDSLDLRTPLVIAVGAEGSGLSTSLLSFADDRVRIPTDPAVDSLNVVVAAGVALHALLAGGR